MQEQHQIGSTDDNAGLAIGRNRKLKGPFFEPLVPDGKAVFLPDQQLDAIGDLVAKHEHLARQRIAAEPVADQGGQAVEATPHIGWFGAEPDLQRRRQA
jgi:hypothetical protein